VKAVIDVNVLLSALLSREGAPAGIMRAWLDGAFDMVVSLLLIAELERAAGYPKLARRIDADVSGDLISLMLDSALMVDDPAGPPRIRSSDPGDDYLIALAEAASAVLVSGDKHLLRLTEVIPVYSPAGFLDLVTSLG
jgi:uncharacterized protein